MTAPTLHLAAALLLASTLGCDGEPEHEAGARSPWPGYVLEATLGSSGDGPGQLRRPMGLDVDADGRLWVADTGNRRVQVLAPDGSVVRVLDEGWERPIDVAVSPRGPVWVADLAADRVRCLQLDGTDCSRPAVELPAPSGLGARERQGPLAVQLYGHRVVSVGGSPHLSVGGEGGGSGQLSHPTDVAVLPGGGFLVADAHNHRIQRFDERGRAADAFRGPVDRPFLEPTGVAVGRDVVHVADSGGRRVVALSTTGRVLAELGLTDDQVLAVQSPVRVATHGDRVYVVDAANDRILVLGRGAQRR